jgi:hypothetical protein
VLRLHARAGGAEADVGEAHSAFVYTIKLWAAEIENGGDAEGQEAQYALVHVITMRQRGRRVDHVVIKRSVSKRLLILDGEAGGHNTEGEAQARLADKAERGAL